MNTIYIAGETYKGGEDIISIIRVMRDAVRKDWEEFLERTGQSSEYDVIVQT